MENSTNDRVLWNSLFLIVLKTKYRQDLWKHLTDFSRASNVFLPMWVVVKSVYLCIVSRLQFGRTPIVCTVVNTNFVNANFVLTRFQTYSVLLFLTANPPADKCNELCKDRELDPKLYESAKKLTSARKAGTFGSSMKSWNWTWNRWNFPNDHYTSHNPSIELSLHLSGCRLLYNKKWENIRKQGHKHFKREIFWIWTIYSFSFLTWLTALYEKQPLVTV